MLDIRLSGRYPIALTPQLRPNRMCKCHPAECRDEGLWRAEIERLRAALREALPYLVRQYEDEAADIVRAALESAPSTSDQGAER